MIDTIGWFFPGIRRREAAWNGTVAARVVQIPGHGMMVADACVDLSGESCLRTNLVTKRVLDAAQTGTVVEIASDNLSAVETIPFMLAGHGCVHLGTVHIEGGWKIYARKAGE
ncbi:MAG: sulfurtransferase TusA family protein [Betaproteobacteria bacterium]|nr:sulfurtransferase TusA family protein [Betaproteobacteria bacterium]